MIEYEDRFSNDYTCSAEIHDKHTTELIDIKYSKHHNKIPDLVGIIKEPETLHEGLLMMEDDVDKALNSLQAAKFLNLLILPDH